MCIRDRPDTARITATAFDVPQKDSIHAYYCNRDTEQFFILRINKTDALLLSLIHISPDSSLPLLLPSLGNENKPVYGFCDFLILFLSDTYSWSVSSCKSLSLIS